MNFFRIEGQHRLTSPKGHWSWTRGLRISSKAGQIPPLKEDHPIQSVRYQPDQRRVAKPFNAEGKLLKLPKLGLLKLQES
jgi:hypothetical protein